MIYRVYYNSCEDWPQIWSVDEGDQSSEITVVGWEAHGCNAAAGVDATIVNGSTDKPKVWCAVTCERMEIRKGIAHFLEETKP